MKSKLESKEFDDMTNENIFDQQFWKEAWDNDPNTQDKRMKRAGLGQPDAPGFETWAENFNKILLLKRAKTSKTNYVMDSESNRRI